jgi:hypothetical protein
MECGLYYRMEKKGLETRKQENEINTKVFIVPSLIYYHEKERNAF